jgi:hypothetical protein
VVTLLLEAYSDAGLNTPTVYDSVLKITPLCVLATANYSSYLPVPAACIYCLFILIHCFPRRVYLRNGHSTHYLGVVAVCSVIECAGRSKQRKAMMMMMIGMIHIDLALQLIDDEWGMCCTYDEYK